LYSTTTHNTLWQNVDDETAKQRTLLLRPPRQHEDVPLCIVIRSSVGGGSVMRATNDYVVGHEAEEESKTAFWFDIDYYELELEPLC
jgi:hypothetical protein